MKETEKTYPWWVAAVMMADGKYMTVSAFVLVHRVDVQTRRLQYWDESDKTWVDSNIGTAEQSNMWKVCDPPEPLYTPCTWQEACALRVFRPSGDNNIKYNGNYWCTAFSMVPECKSGKFEMLTKTYNQFFK